MSKLSLPSREAELLANLSRISAERAEAEERTTSTFDRTTAELNRTHDAERTRIDAELARRVARAEADRESAKTVARSRYEAEKTRLKREYETAAKTNESTHRSGSDAARKKYEEARWQAAAVFDAARDSSRKELEESRRDLGATAATAAALREEAAFLIESRRRLAPPVGESAPAPPIDAEADPRPALADAVARLDDHIRKFDKLPILKIIKIENYLMLQLLIGAVLAYPMYLLFGMPVGAYVLAGVLLVEGISLRIVLAGAAGKTLVPLVTSMRAESVETEALETAAATWIETRFRRRSLRDETKRDDDLREAHSVYAKRQTELDERHSAEKRRLEEVYPPLLAQAKAEASRAFADAEETAAREIADARADHERRTGLSDQTHEQGMFAAIEKRDAAWNELASAWERGTNEVRAEIESIAAETSRLFPEWNVWTPETAPEITPSDLRFGSFKVEVDRIADAVPENSELRAHALEDFSLPAFVSWNNRGSLVIRAADEGREAAVGLLQAAMIRLLTAFPPAKARFTIIDPVGLGQNFASFMHLADHDELLINHRIWTDPQQIDQRLNDLTEHMENVIMTYLRNDYATIEEYNAQAGEVAEPYRFLVIANFPHGFSETSIRKLVSVAKSGARCGVHILMSVDMDQPMPFGFALKELEAHANVLVWRDGGFVWREPRFEHHPLSVDAPPPVEAAGALLGRVGKAAKAARRVEVPFEVVAPKMDALWTGTTVNGVEVPLGRAGATKLQYLSLGRGTSQHVLIAGKTGSGKSTFLHALITNVALRYSPDEIELYLIDFKKGVEFKTYAQHELPHARVVAVESEREFGLSVLQRLDAELKNRGDLYRKAGAQDVAGYRAATGSKLPRILLLVDEFQEFFVEDDKLAQEASLLLDRLVRQGRAFGIHVHLGSQTLGGAYSIARSTLGQMAVRIALQCSESDAHLILSEENTAARLLSRPGEAIYNDANGLIEGNHIFQIVWLGEELREKYLTKLREMADARTLAPRPPMIVFEGNTPAELEKNEGLNRLLSSPDWPKPKRSVPAWLGDAIAIKDPTAAVFQPQSGSNLLMIGQQDESALGIMSGVVAALAAQHDPGSARFILFDGTPSDAPNANVLSDVAAALPHEVERGTTRTLPRIVNELAEEVERRGRDESDSTPIYVFIHDLNRFRDLRKKEDDFGFGSYGSDSAAPPSPSKQFATILREGPMVNVHAVVWCDTVNNLNRTFDRQGLSEFEMRVLFQMSSNDSSNLIDSPAAGKLGPNRAYFHSEEEGRLEKFRPYGLPSAAFLAELKERLASKPKVERVSPTPIAGDAVVEDEDAVVEDAV